MWMLSAHQRDGFDEWGSRKAFEGLVKPFSGFAPWLGGEEMLEVCFEQVAHKAS
jgi:hypothetical protein